MKKVSKSKNDLTLKNIGNLFDQKFDEKFDKKFDQKLLPIFSELSDLKQQITGLDKKIDFVDSKLEAFRNETKENFNGVYDGLSTLADSLDHDVEPRIKRLEDQRLFAM